MLLPMFIEEKFPSVWRLFHSYNNITCIFHFYELLFMLHLVRKQHKDVQLNPTATNVDAVPIVFLQVLFPLKRMYATFKPFLLLINKHTLMLLYPLQMLSFIVPLLIKNRQQYSGRMCWWSSSPTICKHLNYVYRFYHWWRLEWLVNI